MNIKLKKILASIAAVGIGTTILITQLSGGRVEICVAGNCEVFSQNEYARVKADVLGKIERGEALEWREYQLAIAIYDYELKKGPVSLANITGENLLKKLNKELKQK